MFDQPMYGGDTVHGNGHGYGFANPMVRPFAQLAVQIADVSAHKQMPRRYVHL